MAELFLAMLATLPCPPVPFGPAIVRGTLVGPANLFFIFLSPGNNLIRAHESNVSPMHEWLVNSIGYIAQVP